MTRKEFIQMCGLLGIGLPLVGACGATGKLDKSGKVIVIGAGAAGLTAAHLLNQHGVEVQVLEANAGYGGRMKRTIDFADFPIPTGAEWLHVQKSVLNEIVNDESVNVDITTQAYDFEKDFALLEGKQVSLKSLGFSIDQKFINATWFDFFERYIVPGIQDSIRFNQVVKAVNYSGEAVEVSTENETFSADKVIITVPVKLLQSGTIQFDPEIPEDKQQAIDKVTVWGGCKAFIMFSEQFYPVVTGIKVKPKTAGHKLFYDAAYGQNSSQNFLGLFAVGPVAESYLRHEDPDRIEMILDELDELFDGQASKHYQKHIFQNWNEEPFAKGAYVHYYENWRTFRALSKPIDDKLFFAGDAYTDGKEWSSVHAAALSAKRLVSNLVR